MDPDFFNVAVTGGQLYVKARVLLQALNSKDLIHSITELRIVYLGRISEAFKLAGLLQERNEIYIGTRPPCRISSKVLRVIPTAILLMF